MLKLFNNRVVGKITISNTVKGVVKMGYDKFGNKIVYRNFSTQGDSYPMIDLYSRNNSRVIIRELKFK